MSWAAVILAVFKAISAAVDYMERNRMIEAAEAEIFSRYAKGAMDEIKTANAARAAVKSDALRNPGGVQQSDGFRRD